MGIAWAAVCVRRGERNKGRRLKADHPCSNLIFGLSGIRCLLLRVLMLISLRLKE